MRARTEDILRNYGVSARNGFLPEQPPVASLPDIYYAPWESILHCLPTLITTLSIRSEIDALPLLDTSRLHTEAEWQRAYSILGFLTHAYIWGGDRPADRLPPQITCPLLEVSEHVGLPPTATYSGLNLWNWELKPDQVDLTKPENLRSLQTATGTRDEEWFYLISVSVEAKGGPLIHAMLQCVEAVERGDDEAIEHHLRHMTVGIQELGTLLNRMHEHCDPQVFYHVLRPLLAGSKGMAAAGLPNGVFYDEGNDHGQWRQYSGGSNAQSSLIQLFDIVLGVDHHATGSSETKKLADSSKTGSFIQEMRNYMPRRHGEFLSYMTERGHVREYVDKQDLGSTIRSTYNAAVDALVAFRNVHIQIVARYIINPSRCPPSERILQRRSLNLATASSRAGEAGGLEKQQLAGTGGTMLIPFLKKTRDETGEAVMLE
ncbi:hypothetical protein PV10_08270 [Exophiala mesophila]|uniref:Indoleamine 2,3-dioxygenase n=1 Tax=Exophiala mesophila TaxID=212818 RepID=A0A0D1ZPB2_EXOME|nr:uncharacterized protein PV10_08270 [Exophiala mesophila]KIV88603.1 hypothetical protein PV10_08270 [Exophiala mesophila]